MLRLAWVRAGEPATLASLVDPDIAAFLTLGDYIDHSPSNFSFRVVAVVKVQSSHQPTLPVVISHDSTLQEVEDSFVAFYKKEAKMREDVQLTVRWWEDQERQREIVSTGSSTFLFLWALHGLSPVIHAEPVFA